ncbi:helix-turn-helix domain-containing protein [Streptomyces rimosus]|uniref:helix-turn-helix domain-containing protein n=1 Tax=Streptomyces rimosus TaxID=1927 RepID=UPI003CD03A3E
MSLRSLGEATRLSSSYLSRIMSGERFPSWDATARLARACGADPAVLCKIWEDAQARRTSHTLASALRYLHRLPGPLGHGRHQRRHLRTAPGRCRPGQRCRTRLGRRPAHRHGPGRRARLLRPSMHSPTSPLPRPSPKLNPQPRPSRSPGPPRRRRPPGGWTTCWPRSATPSPLPCSTSPLPKPEPRPALCLRPSPTPRSTAAPGRSPSPSSPTGPPTDTHRPDSPAMAE